jgi:hypothetical protein
MESKNSGQRMTLTRGITTAAQRINGREKQDSSELVGYLVMRCHGIASRGPRAPDWGLCCDSEAARQWDVGARWWWKYGDRQGFLY